LIVEAPAVDESAISRAQVAYDYLRAIDENFTVAPGNGVISDHENVGFIAAHRGLIHHQLENPAL
jgi:hypothetical protein